jgi:hypothetical protein
MIELPFLLRDAPRTTGHRRPGGRRKKNGNEFPGLKVR